MNNQFVLIASDDHTSAKNLEQAILSFGCRVATISREYMTSTRVNEFRPSLLILDLERQGSAAHEQLSWQENIYIQQSYPVLALSTQPLQASPASTNLEYLQKPVDVEHVRRHLVELKNTRTSSVEVYPSDPDSKVLDEIRTFLLARCGLDFSWGIQKNLERSLKQRMEILDIVEYADYLKRLNLCSSVCDELSSLIDILTVGETSLFRYEAHDKALVESALPEIIQRKGRERSLKIWSAGCATGEESYTLALLIKKHFPQLLEWDLRILATDINRRFLRQANVGWFSERSMRTVPQDLCEKFFICKQGGYLLSEEIRNMVSFEYLNLHNGQFPVEKEMSVDFDVILCRNVLIYFDAVTRKTTLTRLINNLHPEGYMFFGHTEMMQNVSSRLQTERQGRAFYYKLQTPFECSR